MILKCFKIFNVNIYSKCEIFIVKNFSALYITIIKFGSELNSFCPNSLGGQCIEGFYEWAMRTSSSQRERDGKREIDNVLVARQKVVVLVSIILR